MADEMTMRERIARALHRHDRKHGIVSKDWENHLPEVRDFYLESADAALDPMMEPTNEMLGAGELSLRGHCMDPRESAKHAYLNMLLMAKADHPILDLNKGASHHDRA